MKYVLCWSICTTSLSILHLSRAKPRKRSGNMHAKPVLCKIHTVLTILHIAYCVTCKVKSTASSDRTQLWPWEEGGSFVSEAASLDHQHFLIENNGNRWSSYGITPTLSAKTYGICWPRIRVRDLFSRDLAEHVRWFANISLATGQKHTQDVKCCLLPTVQYCNEI